MATLSSTCHLRWGMLLLVLGWGSEAVAQVENTNAGRASGVVGTNVKPLRPPPSGAVAPPGLPSGEWPQAKRIYFPPDPPPLGARINVDSRRPPPPDVPRELGAHVAEPFYAPLSTCLTDFSPQSQRKFRPRIDAYTKTRERLLVELREVVTAQAGRPGIERAQAFALLAQRQAKDLDALEAEAENLRAALAQKASWYDFRRWKLGSGLLHPRLPEHRVLEFQVVRAAAFYQPGLLPAQRRLLREAAMLMQDEMFAVEPADNATAPVLPPPRLMFFSPDLVRLLPMSEMPGAIAEKLDAFVAEKDALRQELMDTIIAEDKAKLVSNRRRAIGRLAQAQATRLAALDTRAEELRREFAPAFERHRLPRPYTLPAEVTAMIERFFAQRVEMQAMLEARMEQAMRQAVMSYRGNDPRELHDLQIQAQQSVMGEFSEEQMPRLLALDAELERIHGALVASVGEAALRTEGRAPNAFLADYMARYRQSWAYYEYEIAVFEPALSPAQRRLLLGGAIRWLELPLPRAERQPISLPLTILNEEQKKPGARLR